MNLVHIVATITLDQIVKTVSFDIITEFGFPADVGQSTSLKFQCIVLSNLIYQECIFVNTCAS
jgi:hypothetical protein